MSFDLCILMDTTGSMKGWFEEAKSRVLELSQQIPARLVDLKPGMQWDLRLAFVAYKDKPDKPVVQDFTRDFAGVEKKLKEVRAEGGGDIPEDVHGALEAVKELEWAKGGYQVLVHVLDAPPHGSRYHSLASYQDKLFHEDPGTLNIVEQLARKKIYYVMLRCGDVDSIASTSKFAAMCDLVYSSVIDELKKKAGKLPFFKHLELVNSETVVKQFMDLMLRTSLAAVSTKPQTIIPNPMPTPSAPELPACLRFPQIITKVFPSSHYLWPNQYFTVYNRTEQVLCILVSPDVRKYRSKFSSVKLMAGLDGGGFEVGFAEVLDPEVPPTSEILLNPEEKGGPSSALPSHVFPQTEDGSYVTVCHRNMEGQDEHLLLVGSKNVFIPKGAVLTLMEATAP